MYNNYHTVMIGLNIDYSCKPGRAELKVFINIKQLIYVYIFLFVIRMLNNRTMKNKILIQQ